MDDYQCGSRATGILGEHNTSGRLTDMPPSSSTSLLPGTFPSNIWVPRDFHDAGSRAALLAGVDSQRNLHPPTSAFPAARSIAKRMPTLEQQLSILMKEEQRRTLPLTIEQQLASFIEEQQGKRNSFQRSIPSDRALATEHELAFLTDQQRVRHQLFEEPFEASKDAIDRMTIDELLASLNDQRGSLQATNTVPRRSSTIQEQLASSIEHQQGYRGSLQDRMPTIKHHLASMIQATNSASTSFCFPPNLLIKHRPSLLPSLEHLQLLRQLQNELGPHAQPESQAQPEIQAQAGGCYFGNADEGRHVIPLVEVPREFPVPTPPSYGTQEPFPGKLYRLLADAERNGNDSVISFTPDGRAFKIHNRDAFIKEVSPTYFRQAKITSFVRQLNFYGFEKLLDGPNRGSFWHPYFRRGYPELLLKIARISPGSKGGRGAVA